MKRLVVVVIVAVAVAVAVAVVWLHASVNGWFWHPLAEGNSSTCGATDHSGCGYSFWSGSGSDIAEITLIGAAVTMILTFWRKHNCHVHKCWRLSWHPHPGHGHPVCRKHHPFGRGRGTHLAAKHHTDEAHAKWPSDDTGSVYASNATAVGPFGTATVTSTGSFDHEVVVGAPTPEKPKRRRGERKPGTEPVTDITTKKRDG